MRRTPLLFRPPSSAIDATRFTSTSPHAFSKSPVRSSRPSASTFSPSASPSYTPQKPPPSLSSRPFPSSNPSSNLKTTPTLASKSGPTVRNEAAAAGGGRRTPGGGPVTPEAETPAQKVARLRAARAAAKEQIQFSKWDRIVVVGREWADRLHRVFTIGMILLTGKLSPDPCANGPFLLSRCSSSSTAFSFSKKISGKKLNSLTYSFFFTNDSHGRSRNPLRRRLDDNL